MENHASLFQTKIETRQAILFLAALTLSAAVLRLMIAYTNTHYFDISYYVDWSAGAAQDLFSAYETVKNLDYPPLFLFPLTLTGLITGTAQVAGFDPYMMLALKGWQVLFDLAMIPLLYVVLRRHSELLALGAAALWAVNPSVIYNSAYWGQTDCMMLLLLTASFYLLETGRPVWSGLLMALACLMKFQALYFAPLFALALVDTVQWKKILQTAAVGVGTVLAVFAPFCNRSGWDLPWRIYFGGFERYKGASLNAFNFYSANGLNYWSTETPLFGAVTAEQFSMVAIVAALFFLVYFYLTATEKSLWLLGFFFMQTMFMFTTRMHERYQIYVVLLLLVACIVHKSRALFASYLALTLMTFCNQFFVLEEIFTSNKLTGWIPRLKDLTEIFSNINFVLYLVTLLITLHVFYRNGHKALLPALRSFFPKHWGGARIK